MTGNIFLWGGPHVQKSCCGPLAQGPLPGTEGDPSHIGGEMPNLYLNEYCPMGAWQRSAAMSNTAMFTCVFRSEANYPMCIYAIRGGRI